LLALAGCGGGKTVDAAKAPPTTAAPTPAKPASPTPSGADLAATLRLAAVSEEMHYDETGAYTTSLKALVAQDLQVPPGVTVKVVSATKARYCLSATAEGYSLYFDSADGRVSSRRCR
jgi:hypothetical protein